MGFAERERIRDLEEQAEERDRDEVRRLRKEVARLKAETKKKDKNVLSVSKALKLMEQGETVWIKDYTDEPWKYDSPDYPIEDPEDLLTMFEEHVGDEIIVLSEGRPFDSSTWRTRE